MRYIAPRDAADLDAIEQREWLDSLDYVLQSGGPAKVTRLLRELTGRSVGVADIAASFGPTSGRTCAIRASAIRGSYP